ncbi:MAG TPA: hypothetical protein DCP90_06425 [Clostridiales bacterium]|nr:MAG: hypothetical protein A2Y22_00850 [Clostridiales bacterium GWD2_32_59]HAN10231.1 hypothetical protein [Clostridiales bacterium]
MKKNLILLFSYIFFSLLLVLNTPNIINYMIIPFFASLTENSEPIHLTSEVISPLQLLVAMGLVILGLFLLIKRLDHKEDKKVKQGSSFMAEMEELKSLMGDDGFVIAKDIRLSLETSYEHVAIIGPTGCGKSTSFFIPNLLELNGEISAVVSDPKGELYEQTRPYLESLGYNTIKLEPFEALMRYNPILIAEDDTELKEIAQLIMINGNKSYEMGTGGSSGNTEWLSMSEPLLAAAMIYVKRNGKRKDMKEVKDLVIQKDFNEMVKIFSEVPEAMQEFMMFAQSKGAEKTMSGIKVTLANALKLFNDKKIQTFVETPYKKVDEDGVTKLVPQVQLLFHPKMLRDIPTVLFICVPERKSTFVMPLMSVFYSQLLNKCMDYNSYNSVPVLFMLDEFANIGTLPNFANIVSTARSRQLGISIGIQGMEQLKQNYGQDTAYNILNNMKTKMFYSGLTGASADYVSQLAGYTTMQTESISSQKGVDGKKNDSKTISDQRRELLTPDEIRRLPDEKVLIIAHNKNIVTADKNSYFLQKKYTSKIKT